MKWILMIALLFCGCQTVPKRPPPRTDADLLTSQLAQERNTTARLRRQIKVKDKRIQALIKEEAYRDAEEMN